MQRWDGRAAWIQQIPPPGFLPSLSFPLLHAPMPEWVTGREHRVSGLAVAVGPGRRGSRRAVISHCS